MNERIMAHTAEAETMPVEENLPDPAMEALRNEQRLVLAILGGCAAAAVGAGIWALISASTGYQIGFMSFGIGILVGATVCLLGKGVDPVFGIIGGGLSLISCAAGNLLTAVYVAAQEFDVPFVDLLTSLDLALISRLIEIQFAPIDLLFYGIAIYVGYRISFRDIVEDNETPQGDKDT